MNIPAKLVLVFGFTTLLASFTNAQSEGPFRQVTAGPGHLTKPAQLKFVESHLKEIKVPKGYAVRVYAKDLQAPRMMVVSEDGTVYVSIPKTGEIVALKDENSDGVAETRETFLEGYEKVHGMAIQDGQLYFVALKTVYATSLKKGAKVKTILTDLPNVGQHENRSLAIGPDKMLYVSIASNCNSCVDPDPRMATIQRSKLDGSEVKTFATGLRDTLGFDWHPETKMLYGMDHGTDWLGDELPREELNQISEGKNYGWPFCWNDKKPDHNLIKNPEGKTKEEYCPTTVAPVLTHDAHSAPIDFKFYNADLFPGTKGSAFVALHGSWNRKSPVGYSVARVSFKNGQPERFEEFMSGFLKNRGREQFGRPAGLAVLKDGSLLVSDDSGGVIYRVSYKTP